MEPEAEPRPVKDSVVRNWQRFLYHYLRVRSWQRLFSVLGQRLQEENRSVRDRVQKQYPKEK